MSDKVGWILLLAWLIWSWAPGNSFAQSQPAPYVDWDSRFYNPEPDPDDLVLPMACGGAMAFRPVEIPSAGWLDDHRVELGQGDEDRGYKEGRHLDYLAGAFTPPDSGATRVFYIAKYETTRDQYATIENDECPRPSMRGRLPVTDVSWFDAVELSRRYTEWLLKNAKDKLPVEGMEPGFLRLPTEIEWEFATRGGLKVDEADFLAPLFPMPDGGLAQYAWHENTQSAEGKLRPVGLLNPNPLGLYDVLGNAAEMTFAPFHLDHRGRSHGQAGGFVTRGGDIFTPPSQIGSAVRQEHSYFDSSTAHAKHLDSVGFRLVLTAPVIVSPKRLANIKMAWTSLPNLVGNVRAEAEKALKELQDLADRAQDQGLRTKLGLIQRDVEQAHTAINEARSRTVRALIRTGAFMAKRVVTDQVRVNVLKTVIAKTRVHFDEILQKHGKQIGDQERNKALIEEIDAKLRSWQEKLSDSQSDLANTLSYYGDMVISVGRDYGTDELRGELQVVVAEMRVKKSDHLIPYAEAFLGHTSAYRSGEEPDKEGWLKSLVDIKQGGHND